MANKLKIKNHIANYMLIYTIDTNSKRFTNENILIL